MRAMYRAFVRWLAIGCAVLFSTDVVEGIEGDQRLDRDTCYRGVAVLSSSIGDEIEAEEVVDFAGTCKLNLVIIDYAWITHHWPRTDQAQVRRLIAQLGDAGVEVAAMYRPRAMNPSEADVHWAVDGDGSRPEHHNELCLAHEDSVQWGASWGREILEAQPGLHRVIIYNLRPMCRCPLCRDDHERRHAAAFLDYCRRNWNKVRPDVEIGYVGVGADLAEKVDFLCPFLSVNHDEQGRLSIRSEVSNTLAVKSQLQNQPVIPLVKICWASQTNNTTDDVIEAITRCTRAKVGFILWYYEWLFHQETKRYDPERLVEGLGGNWSVMAPYVAPDDRSANEPAARSKIPPTWVCFASKESRAGRGPRLLLRSGRDVREIPVTSDTVLISYTPDKSWPHHPQLALRLDGTNQVLLGFDLPPMRQGAKLNQATLILNMQNSENPIRDPFEIAIHAVTERWHQNTAVWNRRPSIQEEPASTIGVRPKPGTIRIDVTDLVKAWFSGKLANNGILLKAVPTAPSSQSWSDYLRLDDVAVVAVKDFMRIENSGDAIANLTFPRYFPLIDDEQVVLARWLTAQTDDGLPVAIGIKDVISDRERNLIHRYLIEEFPARTGVSVTITSLVLRRERPLPEGRFPILSPSAYPRDIRAFLRSTKMVVVDHPEVRAISERLLGESQDAYEIAGQLAAIMKSNSYKQQPDADYSLPTSARVLKYGGSCCSSAVAAAAVLRACGIPAQITYCPAGYVHGIIRFYLDGYGWCRMDSTSGVGKLPLIQKPEDRGYVRLFDMPIEMESLDYAFAWPYFHNTMRGKYEFHSDGQVVATVRFAARDEEEARQAGRVSGRVSEPFPHLEPGSWNTVLDLMDCNFTDAQWSALVRASRDAVAAKETGTFEAVMKVLGDRLPRARLKTMIEHLEDYGDLPD